LGEESDHHEHDVSGKGFKHLTPTREALDVVLSNLSKHAPTPETCPIGSALGRVLAQDLVSSRDIPSFNRAAMDGFAVRAEDTYGASATAPVFLQSVGSIPIGVVPSVTLKRGETASVATGARLPEGSNAVVMVEYTKGASVGSVEISDQVHPAENVSRIGEDIQKGTVVLKHGTRLLPQDIGILSSLGYADAQVKPKLRIAVLSTGNELQTATTPTPGKIPDVNRPVLLSAIQQLGCEPLDMGIATDEFEQINAKLKRAVETADMVLVTAGTSVGPGDIVPKVISSLGEPGMLVHGVAMRPSMPTGLAVVRGKPIISLPGYPVSAYLAFLEFVPILVNHMLGTASLPPPVVKAKLQRRIAGVLGSRTYVRVQVSEREGTFFAEPVRTSGAGILSSLVQANGFIIVPEHVEGYEEGQAIEVELFRPVEREKSDE
jgi:molybdenum cofactor synthesis domain-containing protein